MKTKIVVGRSSTTAGRLKDLFDKAQKGIVNFDNLESYPEDPNKFLRPHESMSQKITRLIMGSNFRSIADVEFAFECRSTKAEQKILSHIPYSEETLIACKEMHLLVPYFETSLVDLKTNIAEALESGNDWFMSDHPFANTEKTALGWMLVSKECVTDSLSKTYGDQLQFLPITHENPRAIDFVFMLVLEVKLQRDTVLLEYWNEKAWGRKKSIDANANRVIADLLGRRVRVNSNSVVYAFDSIGLVGFRKLKS